MSKATLLEKLTNKEYRDALVSEEIDVGLPMQLRAMREIRGWKQQYVAEKTGTKQPRFSLMEKAGYGKFSLNTLKKLASLFDVGLIVSFVPWGEMIDFVEGLKSSRLHAIGFGDEYPRLFRRYSRERDETTSTSQINLDFEIGNTASKQPIVFVDSVAAVTLPIEDNLYRSVPPELIASSNSAAFAKAVSLR